MIILGELTTAQEVKFIARELYTGDSTAVFTDKLTNISYTYNVTAITDRYYTYFSEIMTDLKNDRSYYFVFSSPTKELYRDNVFVTNQSVGSYDINDGIYIESPSNNEYIVPE